VFAAGLLLATATLVTLTWTAINEMRRSTALLLEQRASEVVALTSVALNRDMKGAWLSMLVPLDAGDITELPPYDLLQRSSRAFARFPYPECPGRPPSPTRSRIQCASSRIRRRSRRS
jgi:hypothetical protein